jgi:hypothetical protein
MAAKAPVDAHQRRISWIRRLILLSFAGLAVAGWANRFADLSSPLPFDLPVPPSRVWVDAVLEVAVASAGENPALPPAEPAGDGPICPDVPPVFRPALRQAFGLMRATAEGQRLYAVIERNGACVGVTELPYNSAFARVRGSPRTGWHDSMIMVDRHHVRSTRADVLAALLVHEATHLDRAFSGQACYVRTTCTTLDNGVELEEEVAAHAAEAAWWIALYGADGKRFALRTDAFENQLARAYQRGSRQFRDFVAEIRSDPREGKGMTPP